MEFDRVAPFLALEPELLFHVGPCRIPWSVLLLQHGHGGRVAFPYERMGVCFDGGGFSGPKPTGVCGEGVVEFVGPWTALEEVASGGGHGGTTEDDGTELERAVHDETAFDVFGGRGLVVKGEEVPEPMDEVGFGFEVNAGNVLTVGGMGIFTSVDGHVEDVGHLFDEPSSVPFAQESHSCDGSILFKDLSECFVLFFTCTQVFFKGFVCLSVDAGVADDEPLVVPLTV